LILQLKLKSHHKRIQSFKKYKSMSKLIKCKSCQNEIASDCKACPNCGSPNKKRGCLSTIFGVSILFVGIIAIALASGMNGSKESSSASETAKDEETASTSKAKDNSSKGESKTAKTSNEREKLKVKGLYIGMKEDELLSVVTPLLKEICKTEKMAGLENLYTEIFDSDGKIRPEAIRETGDGNKVIVPRGEQANSLNRLITYGIWEGSNSVHTIIFSTYFFTAAKTISHEEFVQQFVNAYKLALIGPKALLESGGVQKDKKWTCNLPIGVNVQIVPINFATWDMFLALQEIESKAEREKKIEDAKKGFN